MSAAQPKAARVERVTLAVRQPAPNLVGAAAALARDLQAQLAALFVEDLTLLRVAALPVTREIGRVSGLARPFELPDVERTLRRQAQQLHEQLERAARAASLAWSFEVRRGDLLEQALLLLAPAQAVVLAPRTQSADTPLDLHRRLTAVLDAAAFDLAALEVAMRMAHGATVSVLVGGAQEMLPARERAALQALTQAGKIELLSGDALSLLARGAMGLRGRALVLSGTLARADLRTLRAWLDASAGPLILVG